MHTNPSKVDLGNWLQKLGNNEIHSDVGNSIIRILDNFITNDTQHVFGTSIEKDISTYMNRAILGPYSDDCEVMNNEILNFINEECKEYFSTDTFQSDDG
jgi:hypothetical protein